MAAQRPFASAQQLFAASDAVWAALDEPAWREAFAAHPRIGQQTRTRGHGSIARVVQRRTARGRRPMSAARLALAEGNRQYEERFGRIFIVCAAGRSAAEILAILQRRMQNDGCRRDARGGRAAAPDYAASPSPLAGSELTMGISTHILDTALGRPAAEVPVQLFEFGDCGSGLLGIEIDAKTDASTAARAAAAGNHPRTRHRPLQVRFERRAYLRPPHLAGLYPYVEIAFDRCATRRSITTSLYY
jgi:OHCU decarboxylase